jgi:hypothetical protein
MTRVLFVLLGMLTLGTASAQAGGPCCGCGETKYVCRLVCDVKEELKYEFDMACDPYCLLGRSDCCGKKKVCDCDSLFGFHWEKIWKPNCECKVRMKHTLVKVPVIKQVPVYTCVVERVCCGCRTRTVDTAATQRILQSGVMPVSLEQPVVELDASLNPIPHSTGENKDEATAAAQTQTTDTTASVSRLVK